MSVVSRLLARLRTRGFVGPRYEGAAGRLRFLVQELVARREVVLVLDADDALPPPPPAAETIALRAIRTTTELEPFEREVDAAYHAGYAARWREALGWGEELVLALRGGRVAGFGWVQVGTREGVGCHYTTVLAGEFRVLRVGVLPAFRRTGVNGAFYALLLRELRARGAHRVYIDCARDNLPSLRAQIRAGFRPIAELDVRGPLLGRGCVRWRHSLDAAFYARLGRGEHG